ncbi:dTMP kinase [Porphyromonas gingivalis]|uniref:dTMP kinase n=1 Tax=Porphyromonas gingivalis TaxID=837 RepID=UPI00097D5DCF|nr:dTMP kinase [Porphyromonas gingivalis]ATR93399.1 dTMP kinase [Porphyromonas gingivalis]ATS08400.1 dTMP kinase [Porphyromonas gingivalis]
MFIAIDGPNGVGKSTIAETVQKEMADRGIILTREPSDTGFGQYVKANEGAYSGEHYGMLIASDRRYHIDTIIKPNLDNGKVVICDRYIASSLVLQRFDGVSTRKIWEMNKNILVPDVYVILLADEKELERRLKKRQVFSMFEKKMSRAQEIKYFTEAIRYLKDKGFNVIQLNNNDGELNDNVLRISKLIDRGF